MKIRLTLLIFLICCFHLAISQTIEDYLSAPFPTELTASKDGLAIAWVLNAQGERNIYFAKAPDYEAQKLTDYTGDVGIDLSSIVFSPDSQTLAFISGNSKNPRGEAANPAQLQINLEYQIHLINLESGEIRQLGPGSGPAFSPDSQNILFKRGPLLVMQSLADVEAEAKQVFTARGGISEYAFSPDGKWISFISDRGDHSFLGLWNLSEKKLSYPESSLDHDRYPAWSPDGKSIAFLRIPHVVNKLPFTSHKEANPWSIRILDVETGNAKEVWKAPAGKGSVVVRDLPAQAERIWWTPKGNLVFPWEGNGWIQLYALDLNSREVVNLTPGIGFVEKVNASFNSNELLLTSNIGDIERRKILRLDLSSYELEDLSEPGQINWSPVRIQNGLAFLAASASKPAWPIIRYDGKLETLAPSLFPDNFPDQLVNPLGIDLTASDGFKTRAQLFLPPNHDASKRYPAVIFLHGGSRRQMLLGFNYSQYYSNAYALQQYFAAQGIIALTLNYRSGIGYGLDFREAENYGAGGASEVLDLLAAADYLAGRPDVDATKIIPWGGSYGGFLTAHGLAQAPEKFLAGVDIHGVHNWNQDIPVFAPWYEPEKFPEMAEMAFRSSPMAYVENWEDPVLLIHGDDDRNVLFSESVDLAEVLRKKGIEVEQLVFPDEVHSFILHRNWVSAYQATIEFIQRQFQKP